MKFKVLILITCIFSISKSAVSQIEQAEIDNIIQRGDEQEILMTNTEMMADGHYYFAQLLAEKLMLYKPESPNYNYRIGFIIMQLNGDYRKAIPYLEKAVSDTDKNWDAISIKEKSAPNDSYYYLAKAYHLNNELDKAQENYAAFNNASIKKSPLIKDSELAQKQVVVARKNLANPTKGKITNLGSTVNTKYPEYSPVVSLDGSAIYYTSRRPWDNKASEKYVNNRLNLNPEDIYVSYMELDSTWGIGTRLLFCEADRNEASVSVSTDERRLLLYKDDKGFGDIFYTDFYASRFKDIKPIDIPGLNTDAWETHAVISPDGMSLFFVSDREGGYGGRDLYYMSKKADGTWTEPKNMGPSINTAYEEDAPFVSFDNRTLYFGSNGPTSMGGFDIFYTKLDTDNTWSAPVNMGVPYNSTNDDLFYTTTIDGTRGYLTSFRADSKGDKDIYEIKSDKIGIENIAVLKGKIKTVGDKPIPEDIAVLIKLECINCETPMERKIYPRLKDGVFLTGLDPCKTYKLTYFNETVGNIMKEEQFKTDCITEYKEYYREYLLDTDRMIFIDPPVVDTIINTPTYANASLKHNFGYNKNKLDLNNTEVKSLIAKVEEQIKAGRDNIVLEINSSASKVPTTTYGDNQSLARLRADNVKKLMQDYFKSKGLDSKVQINVTKVEVNGPDYADDSSNYAKYEAYQYVEVTLK